MNKFDGLRSKNRFFTIIVPVYNVEKYLDNCVQSLVGQTFPDLEIILVDDGSQDNSLNKCREWQKKDNRIKILMKANGGQGSARNLGIDHSVGDYILFVDSDDAIAPDTLEKNIEILKKNPEIDCLQYPVYQKYGTEQQHISKRKPELITSDFYQNWLITKKISWITCDKFFKRSLFKNLRFKEGIFYEDNLLLAQSLGILDNIYISDQGLYYYYDRPNSTTTARLYQKREQDSLFVTYEIFKELKKKGMKPQAMEFLLRVLNIRKSLRVNFNYQDKTLKKSDADFLSLSYLLKSDKTFKSKLKVGLFKYLSIG